MYSEVKRNVLRNRKRAIKLGIPLNFLGLSDHFIYDAGCRIKRKQADRAIGLLLQADLIFKAVIHKEKYLNPPHIAPFINKDGKKCECYACRKLGEA